VTYILPLGRALHKHRLGGSKKWYFLEQTPVFRRLLFCRRTDEMNCRVSTPLLRVASCLLGESSAARFGDVKNRQLELRKKSL
jgi:hypothetical protein